MPSSENSRRKRYFLVPAMLRPPRWSMPIVASKTKGLAPGRMVPRAVPDGTVRSGDQRSVSAYS